MNGSGDNNPTEMFFHCANCLASKPANQSPRDWNATETGFTRDRDICVWCRRCDRLVGLFPVAYDG